MNPINTESSPGVKVSFATVGSFVLLVSFFLPWIKIFAGTAAGFELHEIWAPGPYLYAIPVVAGLAIAIGMCGRRNVEVAQLAGGLPFVFLTIALYQYGNKLLEALAVGGYATLITGAFLLCVVPRIERATAVPAKPINTEDQP